MTFAITTSSNCEVYSTLAVDTTTLKFMQLTLAVMF